VGIFESYDAAELAPARRSLESNRKRRNVEARPGSAGKGAVKQTSAAMHSITIFRKRYTNSVNNLRFSGFAIILLTVALVSSCHHAAPVAKRYHFTGRIISIDAENQSAIIDGDDIPGFMSAMAMSYKIKPPSMLAQLAAGDSISAAVVVIEPGNNAAPDYWLESVKVTAHSKSPLLAPKAQHIPTPGDEVPDFQLTDQSGTRISLSQYRGKVLLVTFIYTRCPFPDFCPRVSSNFAEMSRQLAADPALAGRTQLLSISFDPDHDAPKVLREYAFSAAHTHDPALFTHWEFAVPRSADLPKLADFFGVVYKSEGGLITHNLSTSVITPDGKIAKWYHGSDWQVSDLIKDASNALYHKG
jgi:protein SCO1